MDLVASRACTGRPQAQWHGQQPISLRSLLLIAALPHTLKHYALPHTLLNHAPSGGWRSLLVGFATMGVADMYICDRRPSPQTNCCIQ
jgi:hypothetical protein